MDINLGDLALEERVFDDNIVITSQNESFSAFPLSINSKLISIDMSNNWDNIKVSEWYRVNDALISNILGCFDCGSHNFVLETQNLEFYSVRQKYF